MQQSPQEGRLTPSPPAPMLCPLSRGVCNPRYGNRDGMEAGKGWGRHGSQRGAGVVPTEQNIPPRARGAQIGNWWVWQTPPPEEYALHSRARAILQRNIFLYMLLPGALQQTSLPRFRLKGLHRVSIQTTPHLTDLYFNSVYMRSMFTYRCMLKVVISKHLFTFKAGLEEFWRVFKSFRMQVFFIPKGECKCFGWHTWKKNCYLSLTSR